MSPVTKPRKHGRRDGSHHTIRGRFQYATQSRFPHVASLVHCQSPSIDVAGNSAQESTTSAAIQHETVGCAQAGNALVMMWLIAPILRGFSSSLILGEKWLAL